MLQGDCVYAALNATETTETLLGTITIPPSGVGKISAVWGLLMQPLATSAETISGFLRIACLTPGKFKFPCSTIGGAVGAVASQAMEPKYIPVDIPVQPNDVISLYMTANKAMTGTSEGFISVLLS